MEKEPKKDDIQYVVDNDGKRRAVVIPVKGNEAAVEDFLEDLYGKEKIRERRGEETISKEDLLKGLKDDGLLGGEFCEIWQQGCGLSCRSERTRNP